MKTCALRRAFTMVEMLVVIAIIIVIVGLILPAALSALDKAKSAKCAANMASIYRAYQMRTADEQKNYRWVPIRSAGWAGVLLAYVDGKEKIFRCPVDRSGHWGGIDAMVSVGSGADMTVTPLETGRNFPASSNAYFGGSAWVTISTLPDSYLSIGFCNGTPTVPLTGSATWTISEMAFEGSSPATTLTDPTVKFTVTVYPAGSLLTNTLTVVRPGSTPPLPAIPLYDGKGAFNAQLGNSVLSNGAVIAAGMITSCSYGMNDYDIEGGRWSSGSDWMLETYSYFWPKVPASKVLLMDYTNAQIAAHSMASNSPPVTWGANAASFRRHTRRTMSNVLFGDGSVQLMDPATIDPGTAGNYGRYWQPEQP